MSSATSIERATTRVGTGDAKPRDQFKPWHFFVLVSLVAATAAVLMARQARPEHLVLISLTIGAAGFAAAALYRTLAPLVSADAAAGAEPLTESMRATLEREKVLALRAIKDLEFDRAMGKLSTRDFEEMTGRLRQRAMMLMKQLDAESAYRELIEQELRGRLRRQASSAEGTRLSPTTPDRRGGKPSSSITECVCGTANDADAAFCKRCGSRLAAAGES